MSMLAGMDIDLETRHALIDEIKRRIPNREQKRVAGALATALRTGDEAPRFNRLLQGDEATANYLLGPAQAKTVLHALAAELKTDADELLEAARRAVRSRPRPTPDRHPAWTALGTSTPWVDEVPGLTGGLEALRGKLTRFQGPEVIYLVGPSGIGKTAWLQRAHDAGIGVLVTERADEPTAGSVFLVDDPPAPEAWLAWANRWRVRLVIAAASAPEKQSGAEVLTLTAWSQRELSAFVGGLRLAPAGVVPVLDDADLDAIERRLPAVRGIAAPLPLGHALRLMVDEPHLTTASERELQVSVALHQVTARAALSAGRTEVWRTHGRRAAQRAASLAIRSASASAIAAPIAEAELERDLARVAGPSVGHDVESLLSIVERARRASPKNPLKKLEEWAATPSASELVELLVEAGLWRRGDRGLLTTTDDNLAVMLAADGLEEEWMWERLLATLADPSWSVVRQAWASSLSHVEARVDVLLAKGPAVHAGAMELAIALVAHAAESPRADQVAQVVYATVQLVLSVRVFQAQLGMRREGPKEDLRIASRRFRSALPPLTTSWTADELARRGTEATVTLLATLDELAEQGELWGDSELFASGLPAWATYARLLPWQALGLLRDPSSRRVLRDSTYPRSWEPVILDHAADGDRWARAIATGDVEEEDDREAAVSLVTERAMLDSLVRWRGPRDRSRHQLALGHALFAGPRNDEARDGRLHRQAVTAVANLAQAHPDLVLPDTIELNLHERVWREGLVRAGSTDLLEAWLAVVQRDLARGLAPEEHVDHDDPTTYFALPAQMPQLTRLAEQQVWLAEALHTLGRPEALRSLCALPARRHGSRREEVSWTLAVGAAKCLLRLREAAPLREALARERGGHGPAYEVLHGDHDDETETWIADEIEYGYDAFLARIPGRPRRRELARRWARAGTSHRQYAAARWLLEHGEDGEAELVIWLFRDEPIGSSQYHARAGLRHPDHRVRQAAASLLQRALTEAGTPGGLFEVARAFCPGKDRDRHALYVMKDYLDEVSASDQVLPADCVRALIRRLQVTLAGVAADEARVLASMCERLAQAARPHSGVLGPWLRAPMGDGAVDDDVARTVRHHLAAGLVGLRGHTGLDRQLLQIIASWNDALYSVHAQMEVLEGDAITDAQLEEEWRAATDAVLLGKESASTRWYAVQELLQRRAPDRYAAAFTERLLALPAELKRSGVLQISQVAMFDARHAARLSALFD